MAMLKVCGLWIKESKSGQKYLTGLDIKAIHQLDPDKHRIMIFKNDKKDKQGNYNEKAPDYSVMAAENDPKYSKSNQGGYMKPQGPAPVSRPQPNRGNYPPPPASAYVPPEQAPWPDEEDIGF